jgi:ABC-2 type transport system permease protein
VIKMTDFLRSTLYLAKATLREKSFTFWVLLFPLLLATFYHVALSNVFTFKVESIPVAVQEESFAAYVFPETGLFDITLVENDEEGYRLAGS